MNAMIVMKDVFIVSSILGLVLLGLVITLKSGVMSVGRERGRLMLANLSHLVVALAGCLAFLTMVQQIVGFRIGSRW